MRSVQFKKIISAVLSLTLAFTMAAGASTTYGASYSDINKLKQENAKAQQEIDKLSKEKSNTNEYIAAIDKKIQIIKDQINTLNSQADDLQSSINSVSEKITDTENEMQRIQDEIEKKQEEFDKIYDEYCQRLRAMYVSGHASNLEVLLTSSDISSILTRSEMIKSVSRKDSNTLNELTEKMNEIEKDKASLTQKRAELNEDKSKLESQKKELDANISEVNSTKAELDAEMAKANKAMANINSDIREYRETMDNNSDEMKALEDEIRREQAANSGNSGSGGSNVNTGSGSGSSGSGSYGGSFHYPTDSRTISAGFPTYSGGGWHGGVDFPVSTGSNVYAAASGKVIVAKTLNYSYGYHLVIDHGNGLSTLYAHNSALLVGYGEYVNKGQIIARSGSTGNSTGPHCHFEVRINGTQVNPMNYL